MHSHSKDQHWSAKFSALRPLRARSSCARLIQLAAWLGTLHLDECRFTAASRM